MKVLSDVVQSIINVGPSVMLPIIIFIVGLIFRLNRVRHSHLGLLLVSV